MAESRPGSIELTELIKYDLRFIWERLTKEVYNIDFLKKRGYTIKGTKVFAHSGAIISQDLGEAFIKLGFKPDIYRPKHIFVTDKVEFIPEEAKVVEHFNRFFYADDYVKEVEIDED